MNSDIVFCIFSFNRYLYLKNCIDSIETFFPERPVVIYDDNSDQQELLNYYKDLNAKENYSIEKIQTVSDQSKHGGLYGLMNLALKNCREKNYIYSFFIQDDMQFIQNIDLDAQCRFYFEKYPEALMLSPLFMQKIFLPEIDNYIEKNDGDFFFRNYGVADAGIIHLGRAKKAALNFSSKGERHNGEKYYKLGYKLLLSWNPCLAWVPWALSFKHNKKTGAFLYKKNKLFIKPIDDDNHRKLLHNTQLPFLEDYCRLNRWWIPKPYIHLIHDVRYIVISYWKYLRFLIFKNE